MPSITSIMRRWGAAASPAERTQAWTELLKHLDHVLHQTPAPLLAQLDADEVLHVLASPHHDLLCTVFHQHLSQAKFHPNLALCKAMLDNGPWSDPRVWPDPEQTARFLLNSLASRDDAAALRALDKTSLTPDNRDLVAVLRLVTSGTSPLLAQALLGAPATGEGARDIDANTFHVMVNGITIWKPSLLVILALAWRRGLPVSGHIACHNGPYGSDHKGYGLVQNVSAHRKLWLAQTFPNPYAIIPTEEIWTTLFARA